MTRPKMAAFALAAGIAIAAPALVYAASDGEAQTAQAEPEQHGMGGMGEHGFRGHEGREGHEGEERREGAAHVGGFLSPGLQEHGPRRARRQGTSNSARVLWRAHHRPKVYARRTNL